MLLLQIAVAGSIWWAETNVGTAAAADAAAQERVAAVRVAGARLSDTQSYLDDYLRTGAAADHDALQAELGLFVAATGPLTDGGGAGLRLKAQSAELAGGLSSVVSAAATVRQSTAALLELAKQGQNALSALSSTSARMSDRAIVDAISAATTEALRPLSGIGSYVGSEAPGEAGSIRAGLAALDTALQGILTSSADVPARLRRVVATVDTRMKEIGPALLSFESAMAARASSLVQLKEIVRGIHGSMDSIAEQITAQRGLRHDEMLAARGLVHVVLQLAVVFGVLLSGSVGALVGLSITRPLRRLGWAMDRLAQGALATAVPDTMRRDEIGGMAGAVHVFKETMNRNVELASEQDRLKAEGVQERRATLQRLANEFEDKVGEMVASLASGSTELEATAQSMTGAAAQTDRQATAVSMAAEQASAGVQTAAVAAEQLARSISEISRQMVRSSEVNGDVVVLARETDRVVRALAEGADRIGQVVELISSIAAQTNLLALNATIEAARAGESGRGFAVVAAEVKNLAGQTARATQQIGSQIEGIQATTRDAVQAIGGIAAAVDAASEIASTIAAAVEEQGAATAEISRNVQETAIATQDVTATIGDVRQVASSAGFAAGRVLTAAGDVSKQARRLSVQVNEFVTGVRAA